MGHSRFSGKPGVLDVQFDQSLGMLRYKRYGRDYYTLSFCTSPPDFSVRCGANPLKRAHTALKTKHPVEVFYSQSIHNSFGCVFHLPPIWIAPRNHSFRQAVRRNQQPVIHTCTLQAHAPGDIGSD